MLYMESLGKKEMCHFLTFFFCVGKIFFLFDSLERNTLAVPKGRNEVRNLLLRSKSWPFYDQQQFLHVVTSLITDGMFSAP